MRRPINYVASFWVMTALVWMALFGLAYRTYRYMELREAIRPHIMDRCVPEKPLRVYPLELET